MCLRFVFLLFTRMASWLRLSQREETWRATEILILRWHRDIVRRRWAARSMRGRTGRPATRRTIKVLVLRLARENPGWGYRRIHGELAGMGVKIAAPAAWEILKNAGIDPAAPIRAYLVAVVAVPGRGDPGV
jgi:transposase